MKELVKKIKESFKEGGYELMEVFASDETTHLGNPWTLLYVHADGSVQIAFRVILLPHHAVNMAFLLRGVAGLENMQILPNFVNKEGQPIQVSQEIDEMMLEASGLTEEKLAEYIVDELPTSATKH